MASGEWYVVERSLGGGEIGVVALGRDTRSGSRVAVKRLRPDLQGRGALATRFVNDAKALATVQHPNIVSIFGVYEEAQGPCVVMELLEGDDLAQEITRRGPFAVGEVAALGHALLRGLAAAHGVGLVHGRISPAKVRRHASGVAKLIAWGGAAPGATPPDDIRAMAGVLAACLTGTVAAYPHLDAAVLPVRSALARVFDPAGVPSAAEAASEWNAAVAALRAERSAGSHAIYCRLCGRGNAAGSRFCGDCGKPLGQRCGACGQENAPGVVYCGACGVDFERARSYVLGAFSSEIEQSLARGAWNLARGALGQAERYGADAGYRRRIAERAHAAVQAALADGRWDDAQTGLAALEAFGVPPEGVGGLGQRLEAARSAAARSRPEPEVRGPDLTLFPLGEERTLDELDAALAGGNWARAADIAKGAVRSPSEAGFEQWLERRMRDVVSRADLETAQHLLGVWNVLPGPRRRRDDWAQRVEASRQSVVGVRVGTLLNAVDRHLSRAAFAEAERLLADAAGLDPTALAVAVRRERLAALSQRYEAARRRVAAAGDAGDLGGALSAIDEMLSACPDDAEALDLQSRFNQLRSHACSRLEDAVCLTRQARFDEAFRAIDGARSLWALMPGIKEAMEAVVQARGQFPELVRMARELYHVGDFDQAAALASQTLTVCEDAEEARQLQREIDKQREEARELFRSSERARDRGDLGRAWRDLKGARMVWPKMLGLEAAAEALKAAEVAAPEERRVGTEPPEGRPVRWRRLAAPLVAAWAVMAVVGLVTWLARPDTPALVWPWVRRHQVSMLGVAAAVTALHWLVHRRRRTALWARYRTWLVTVPLTVLVACTALLGLAWLFRAAVAPAMTAGVLVTAGMAVSLLVASFSSD